MEETRQMRNSLGVLNIYWKALWWSLLYMLCPGAAILLTWHALFENPGAWIYAIFSWVLCGFWGWALRHRFWDIWRDAFGRRTTMRGRVGRKWDSGKKYHIVVNDHSFGVSKKIYDRLAKDDAVVVCYWPKTETVAKVQKLSA